MAKTKEREQAQSLRKTGVSIKDIAKKMSVSTSTVSLWCRDIVLSKAAIQKIVSNSQHKSTLGILRYTESLRLRRQQNVLDDRALGALQLGLLSDRDIFCLGLGLYWGEGYKKGNQEFGFTNSDSKMISFYLKWLSVVFAVTAKDLILRVSINELHKHRIDEVQGFWVRTTGIPISQFTAPSLIKTKSLKTYSNHSDHYGTLRVKVRRGTRMRRQILGAIDSVA